ncbi:hypothetical protein MBT84_02720 [Streptomyces sp. MBT84]|nr:hypothetical protein [Streptomyces sp. MBT84]
MRRAGEAAGPARSAVADEALVVLPTPMPYERRVLVWSDESTNAFSSGRADGQRLTGGRPLSGGLVPRRRRTHRDHFAHNPEKSPQAAIDDAAGYGLPRCGPRVGCEPDRVTSLMRGCACRPDPVLCFVAVHEVAVGQPPVALVVGRLPGLVGSGRLRDPFVELREGMRP